ncbi:MAG: helix-turn-helix transcriptional regulator [Betaproteobacteria bacterium]|nr:helix-turn-helix transcriptional regulator [Betaproteobacteria bacterium]
MVDKDRPPHAVSATNATKAIPVASMVESIVGCKWSVGLLWLLADGCSRPSAILRASTGLSPKVMNERLRKMLRFGIVSRTVFGDKPPIEVEYVLTPFGRRFIEIIDEVRRLQEAVDRGAISEGVVKRKGAARRGRLTSG